MYFVSSKAPYDPSYRSSLLSLGGRVLRRHSDWLSRMIFRPVLRDGVLTNAITLKIVPWCPALCHPSAAATTAISAFLAAIGAAVAAIAATVVASGAYTAVVARFRLTVAVIVAAPFSIF